MFKEDLIRNCLIDPVIASSVHPDRMPRFAVYDPGPHCLSMSFLSDPKH